MYGGSDFSSVKIDGCRPGKKVWSISWVLDDKKSLRSASCFRHVECYKPKNKEITSGRVITRTLRFGDGEELELELVHDTQEGSRKNYSLPLALIVLMVLGITCAV